MAFRRAHSRRRTRGVKFGANMVSSTAAAINISPVGRNFMGDYRLRFDMWINANGPFPLGGNGSTEHLTAGVATAGNRVQWTGAGSTADGYWFAVDGEGQASDTSTTAMNDFDAFSGTTRHAAESGVFAAGVANNAATATVITRPLSPAARPRPHGSNPPMPNRPADWRWARWAWPGGR